MAGDNAGILVRGIKRGTLCVVGFFVSLVQLSHTHFECEVYVLKKEEGGRHSPFFNGYKPQFYVRTTDVTGDCTSSCRNRDGYAWRYS